MLVIANGAFKHGSTWLFHILKSVTHFEPPPAEYLNPTWVNPSIRPGRLRTCLEQLDYHHNHYLVKNHFDTRKQRDLILTHPGVVVFDIKRDLRDVVVSAYYHDVRLRRYYGDFHTYYWQRGRRVANGACLFHRLWSLDSPQIYISSYERLQSSFEEEVGKIALFLGLDLPDEEIARVQKATHFNTLNEASVQASGSKLRFYRKGVVGDWQNHFDEQMHADIVKIERQGLSLLEWAWLKLVAFPREFLPKFLSPGQPPTHRTG